jgi:thymidine kinase
MDAAPPPQLVVIAGPMFCGKSSDMIRRVRRTQYGPRAPRCLVIKFVRDTRYDDAAVTTHDGARLPAEVVKTTADIRAAVIAHAPDVLAVDEAQFFPGIANYILTELLAPPAGGDAASTVRTVIVAALQTDFRGTPYAETQQLLAHADEVLVLRAVCRRCGSDRAMFSHRLVPDQRAELIGGAESYEARCRTCFFAAVGNAF